MDSIRGCFSFIERYCAKTCIYAPLTIFILSKEFSSKILLFCLEYAIISLQITYTARVVFNI